jgi:hypothetical protein
MLRRAAGCGGAADVAREGRHHGAAIRLPAQRAHDARQLASGRANWLGEVPRRDPLDG